MIHYLRDFLYLIAIMLIVAYMPVRDATAPTKPAALECDCAERDYLGRPLVASYCGRSAQIQTKRCTYRRILT